MSSSSQSVNNNTNTSTNPNFNTGNTIIHSAYANDPRYRFKHDDDSNTNDYSSAKTKPIQQKAYSKHSFSNNAIASNSSSSFNNNNNSNLKTNETIINPFFINTQSDMANLTNGMIINTSDLIINQPLSVEKHLNTTTTTTTSSLPPIISGKRINLPLGPHRYL